MHERQRWLLDTGGNAHLARGVPVEKEAAPKSEMGVPLATYGRRAPLSDVNDHEPVDTDDGHIKEDNEWRNTGRGVPSIE